MRDDQHRALPFAQRLLQPGDAFRIEERWPTALSKGGQRSASSAISMRRSISQPSAASIFSCNSACSARRVFISSSLISSANLSEISLKRCIWTFSSVNASMTFSPTDLSGLRCGSCGR
jgi:hypothetical protein